MKYLIMTVGLPRSGKSTWARSTGFPIVNPDSIRLALHGQRHLPEAEPMVWTIARYMVDSLHLAGHDVVILDATNVQRKRREEWRSKKYELCFYEAVASKELCIERALALNDLEIIPVIERMAQQYDPLEAWDLRWKECR